MTTALMDCPICQGHDPECEACGGYGAVPDDFAEKIANSEGYMASCEHCGGYAVCVTMPGRLYDIAICAVCYADEHHPDLREQMDAERAERYRAMVDVAAVNPKLLPMQRAWAQRELARIEEEAAVKEAAL